MPTEARSGERVQLLDDGSFGGVAGRDWEQIGVPRVELEGFGSDRSFVAPAVTSPTTLTFRYAVCNFDSGCDYDEVEVMVLPNICGGDCNGDGHVSIDELVKGVRILLEMLPVSACPAFDLVEDGQVHVSELVTAANNALTDCAGLL